MPSPQVLRTGSRSRKPSAKAVESAESAAVLAPPKRKRRNQQEIERDAEVQHHKKEVEAQQRREAVGRVARIEQDIAHKHANALNAHPRHRDDINPKPTNQEEILTSDKDEYPQSKKHRSEASAVPVAMRRKVSEIMMEKAPPHRSRESQRISIEETIKDVRGKKIEAPMLRRDAQETPRVFSKLFEAKLSPSTDIESPSLQIAKSRALTRTMSIAKIPRGTYRARKREIVDMGGHSDSEDSEGDDIGESQDVSHWKMKGSRKKQQNNHPTIRKPAPAKMSKEKEDISSSEDTSELDSDPTPKKKPSSRPYEKLTDDEDILQTSVDDVNFELTTKDTTETETETDDEKPVPAPKKKIKVAKMTVRDAIKAARGESVGARDWNMHDPAVASHTTFSKSVKTGAGVIQDWATNLPPPSASSISSSSGSSTTTTSTIRSKFRTTTSGNTVAAAKKIQVPSKRKIINESDNDSNEEYGAIIDEDEVVEREAAMSSPIKGRKKLSSDHLVKVEEPKRKNGYKFTNDDLPPGAQDEARWRRKVIPLLITYLGGRKDIWSFDINEAVTVFQQVWSYVYGASIPIEISSKSPVYGLAGQRLHEWRSTFGSSALTILQEFFETRKKKDLDTDKARQAYAEDKLYDSVFIYGQVKVDHNGNIKKKDIFFGVLVLRTFATYILTLRGVKPIKNYKPKRAAGALALVAAAVERALTLWRDGCITCESIQKAKETKPKRKQKGKGKEKAEEPRNTSNPIIKQVNPVTGKRSIRTTAFDHANWGRQTLKFYNAIEKNLTNDKFDQLIEEATAYAQSRRGDLKAESDDEDNGEPAVLAGDDSDYGTDVSASD